MIGTILFFLLAVHLALGILASLLAVPSRALGARFFRFNATISLTLLALAEIAYFVYGASYADAAGSLDGAHALPTAGSRTLALKAQIDAANPWLFASGGLALGHVLALPFGRPSLSRALLAASALCGGIFLWVAAAGLQSPSIPAQAAALVFPLDFFLSSLALGSVVVCMILGHWYLVEPGMSVKPLRTVAALFIAVVVARLLLGGYTSVFVWRDFTAAGADLLSSGVVPNLLFFSQRVLFGLALPLALSWMIWQTVKIRSTQSATGILYVAVVFILFGEFLSHYILVSTGYPL
jgi:hypothetical protein